jgi:hypothetical protein
MIAHESIRLHVLRDDAHLVFEFATFRSRRLEKHKFAIHKE